MLRSRSLPLAPADRLPDSRCEDAAAHHLIGLQGGDAGVPALLDPQGLVYTDAAGDDADLSVPATSRPTTGVVWDWHSMTPKRPVGGGMRSLVEVGIDVPIRSLWVWHAEDSSRTHPIG